MLLTEHVLACCFLRLAVRPACSNHSQRCPAPALMSTMPLHGRLGLHLSFLSLGAAHRHFPLPSGAAPLSNFKALHKLQRIHKIHKLHKSSKGQCAIVPSCTLGTPIRLTATFEATPSLLVGRNEVIQDCGFAPADDPGTHERTSLITGAKYRQTEPFNTVKDEALHSYAVG